MTQENPMNDVKSIFASKTVWGGAIAVAAAILGFLGYTVAPEDQTALVEAIASIGSAIGGAVAIYGRVVATKRIGTAE
jgi:hypothetical protein